MNRYSNRNTHNFKNKPEGSHERGNTKRKKENYSEKESYNGKNYQQNSSYSGKNFKENALKETAQTGKFATKTNSTEKSFHKEEKNYKKTTGNYPTRTDKQLNNPFPRTFRRQKDTQEEAGKGIRINKYIANSGICARREAEKYITSGNVTINGKVMSQLSYRVQPHDVVKIDGKNISAEKKEYILLNKPKGFITTTADEKGRKTVMDLIANATTARVNPVGRLDRPTTGLLLFTNDGDLLKKLTHPSHGVRKIYHVILDRKLEMSDYNKIQDGITLEDGLIEVDEIHYVDGAPKNEIGIRIHSGRNRIVRRIFEHLGYSVEKLDRVVFAGLTKKDLPRGTWRHLTPQEVINLKNMS